MWPKTLLSGFVYSLISILMLLQVNIVLAIASDSDNPITSAITSAITDIINPSPSPSATPTPTPTPSSAPITSPITSNPTTNYTAVNLTPGSFSDTPDGYGTLTVTLTEKTLSGLVGVIEKGYVNGSFTKLTPNTLYTIWFVEKDFLGYNPVRSDQMLSDQNGNINYFTADFEIYHRIDQPIQTVNIAFRSLDQTPGDSPCNKYTPCLSCFITFSTVTSAPTPTPSPTPTATPIPQVTPTISTVFPNPATLGTNITLTGSNFANSSKVYVGDYLMPVQSNSVSDDGNRLTFVLTAEVTFLPDKTYLVYVQNGNSKSNELSLTIAPSFTQGTPAVGAKQALVAPLVTLDSSRSEVVMASSNFNTTITVPSSVNNPIINFENLLTTSGNLTKATFNNIININRSTNLGEIAVQIPALTTISGPTGWTGKINAPQILNNSLASPIANSGKTASVSNVVEIGSDDTVLTFDKAVRILIPNQAGKLIGFQRGSVFTKMTNSCTADSQATGDSLSSNSDCYISVGNDLIIWTKHFTKFVTYTESSVQSSGSSSSSSSGNSSNNNSQPGVCTDTKPQTAPKLLSAVSSGRNQVTLTWSKASDPVTYYLITYGTKPGAQEYGNPNIGGKDTTSYVVKGLNNNQTYYFKVRAGNNCMPGEFSNEVSTKPSGDNLTGPAKGFKPGVLSAQDQKTSAKTELKYRPISQVNPSRIISESANVFKQVINFFSNLFKRG